MAKDRDLEGLKKRLAGETPAVPEETLPIRIRRSETFPMTAAEAVKLCDSNPNHPKAQVIRRAIFGMKPDKEVIVDRVDVVAILENTTVQKTATFQNIGQGVIKVTGKENTSEVPDKKHPEAQILNNPAADVPPEAIAPIAGRTPPAPSKKKS